MSQLYTVRAKDLDALEAVSRARDLDPLSVVLATEASWPLFAMAEYERAAEQCARALTMDSTFGLAHFNLAWAYERLGRLDAAMAKYERGAGAAFIVAYLIHALVRIGRIEEARTKTNALIERPARGERIHSYVAIALDALGQLDDALRELDLAIRAREPIVLWIASRPSIYGVEHWIHDQRFAELKRRVRPVGPDASRSGEAS